MHEDVMDEALGEPVRPVAPSLDKSGRWTLILQNVGWGMGLYGWGIPYVLGSEDFKWYLDNTLASLAGAFSLTWKYTKDMELPEARSQMQRYGGVVGFHHGVALSRLLKAEGKLPVLILMAAVPAGTWAGNRLYDAWQIERGQAYALAVHGGLGRSVMSLIHRQIDARPVEPPYPYAASGSAYEAYENDLKAWRRINALFQVAGYPIGTYLGHRLYGDRQYSFGDAFLLITGNAAGALYGFLAADLIGLDIDEKSMAWRWFVTAGGIGGVVGMDRYIQGVDYSFGQFFLMTLGAVSGAALAVAGGVLLEIREASFYELAVIGGSLGGFALTRRIIRPIPESRTGAAIGGRPAVQLSLAPLQVGRKLLPGVALSFRW